VVIFYKQGQGAPQQSTRKRVADAVFDFADQYQGTRQRQEAHDAQLQQRQAQMEADQAALAIQQENQNFVRSERDRVAGERQSDAEIRRLLLDEARGSTTPTAARSPQMGALGMLGNVLGKAFGGQSNDPDAKMAQEEQRKWDAYERWLPTASPETAKLVFSKLAGETQEKQKQAQYGALARRVAQLQMPAQSPGGAELPGLNQEDPEQGELLANLQGMIDNGEDPDQINDVVAELEGEILRDRKHQVARERASGRMMQALAQPPEFVSQEEIDQADEIALSFQNDISRDPKDAWEEFRDALFAGKDRWRAATEEMSKITMKESPPRLPTPEEVMNAGRLLYPHDPKFQNQTPPLSSRVKAGVPEFQDQQAMAGGPIGYSSKYGETPEQRAEGDARFGQNGAQPAQRAVPTEVRQEVQAKLTPDVMDNMMTAVSDAGSVEEANAALVAVAEKAGVDPAQLPEYLLKALGARVGSMSKMRSTGALGGAHEALKSVTGGPAGKPEAAPDVEFQEQEAFKDGPIAYSTKVAEQPEPKKAYADLTPEEQDAKRRARQGAPPKTWKRLSKDEQTSASAELLNAVKAATRFDFHGALAPTLRRLGIDLGSIPKKEAQALREALKKARAGAKK